MTPNQELLANFDLNLIRVFLTIYRECSVSRAAEQLNVGQPAVSASLSRLRQRFGDRLFIRMGRGVVATEKADVLASQLMPVMKQIEATMKLCPRP